MFFATVAVRRRRLVGRGRWCCAQSPAVGLGVVVAALVLDEDTVPSRRLGQHVGGAAAALAVGRAVTPWGPAGKHVPGRPPKV